MQVTKARESCIIIVYAGTVRKTKKLLQTESILVHWEWLDQLRDLCSMLATRSLTYRKRSQRLSFLSVTNTPH